MKKVKKARLKRAKRIKSPELAARAAKDPQPSIDRIDQLANRVLRGDILLPKFQRGLTCPPKTGPEVMLQW